MTVQKQYEVPTIEIVKLLHSDTIVTSPVTGPGDTDVDNPFGQ